MPRILASVVLCLCSVSADAAIVYQSQARSTHYNGMLGTLISYDEYGDLDLAPDFSLFDSTISYQAVWPDENLPQVQGEAIAAQTSSLGQLAISANGSGYALAAIVDEFTAASAQSGGWSDFSVTFELTEPAAVSLSGTFALDDTHVTGPMSFIGFVSLGQDGSEIFGVYLDSDGPGPFDFTGTLPAGTYDLTASAHADMLAEDSGLQSEYGSASYDLTFAIPAPGALALLAFAPVLLRRRWTT